jgi:hypothetical protein
VDAHVPKAVWISIRSMVDGEAIAVVEFDKAESVAC